jgi:hypothetical protein
MLCELTCQSESQSGQDRSLPWRPSEVSSIIDFRGKRFRPTWPNEWLGDAG